MKRIVVYFIFMVLIVSCTRTTKRMRQAKQDSGPEVIINPNPDPLPIPEPEPDPIPEPDPYPNPSPEPAPEQPVTIVIDESYKKALYETLTGGDRIQVEGIVRDHVIKRIKNLIDEDILNNHSSNIEQILALRDDVYENWMYMHDPEGIPDTWRPASITLGQEYKEAYSGDCDDFAIVMASFSKQLGLKSRFVAACSNLDPTECHAWAEFEVPSDFKNSYLLDNYDKRYDNGNTWVSLDWGKGDWHNKFTEDMQILTDMDLK